MKRWHPITPYLRCGPFGPWFARRDILRSGISSQPCEAKSVGPGHVAPSSLSGS